MGEAGRFSGKGGTKMARWPVGLPCGRAARSFHATDSKEAEYSSLAHKNHSRQVSPHLDWLEGRPATHWAHWGSGLAHYISSYCRSHNFGQVQIIGEYSWIFTHEDVISSFDVPKTITQLNSWNLLEISIYSLYQIWNMEILAVKNGCFTIANTPSPTLRALLVLSKEKNQTIGTIWKTLVPLLLKSIKTQLVTHT
jgi:hypothetical protein